ncbi:Methyltransferase domain-containing protein [Pseudovibrio ascidiaceicola]|uniref:Methyltransferase domain-containing protein n=1 Tax=Pseudovibrio ascidiaceicola TaxID=285279 RepID=A0A1I4FS60_9HYPH|nr:FkbM family methyltransferase [Pseudovibrio ascidiaceicola]SFL19511.1 Methyltransferase domain-containing protein [Pseudovibrio ascidiaceicola]
MLTLSKNSETSLKAASGADETWSGEKTIERLNDLEKRVRQLERKYKQEYSPATSLRARSMVQNFCKHLTPMDPVGLFFERVGRNLDGGYVMAKHYAESGIAYSLGIKSDVSWDIGMVERGYKIFQYDHTIDALPFEHPYFNFRKQGITGETSAHGMFSSLSRQIQENDHFNETEMILKMDIEGHEWSVFNDIAEDNIRCFSQILVEIHGLKDVDKLVWQRTRLPGLEKLAKTHQVVHVHANNNSELRIIGGYPIPTTMELTLLRKDICDFKPCKRNFPTEIDQPNNPNYAEHILGTFQF